MIPCYSEPTEIVEMTLKACYDMDYPAHKITCWVCDDGKKEDMKNMVELVGSQNKGKTKTRYIARTKIPGVPHHAKAGNLNNCILKEGSSGQLIIILDCDMLPEPCMARTVAPFFFKKLPLRDGRERQGPADLEDGRDVQRAQFDNETGLLQTPQAFYNLDTNDLLGQSYAFFYECLMSGWDGTSCTPCCGTGVTFNRYALEKVGGFSTGSITEDFKTSLNLCANGFKCKYFLQRMTRGVSPKELNAFMVQRLRWAVGAIQIVLAGNPLFISGLHFRARWLYFFSTVGIVYIIPVVVMGCIMYGTILAGAPISFGPTSFEQYLIIGFTANVLMMLMQYLAGWRLSSRDYLRALQDNFTVFMTLIRAILIGFCGMEMGFAVTNKDVSFDLRANLHHAAPHLFVYVFSGTAMVKGVIECLSSYGLFSIPWTTNYNVSLIYFSLMWTIFIWVMVSGPPRMVLYGYLRARREARSAIQCTNGNVPALQELPSTPMNTFPPLTPELWVKPTLTYGQPPTPKTTGALSAGVASPGSDVENAVSERDDASTVVAPH
ncbi:nucleotide-diphospho-sugar transferase [Tribonema minus]|uniref:Nucleotide-diphospho-sugar transferase n=1 Tax=Tribonema minus TaxID=303371 RepID=A0A835ZDA2_9STRA|nr:nucleotide-diphospho-sugar transferase [Tribonema minus]